MPFLHKNKNASNSNSNNLNNNMNFPYTNATIIPVNQAAPLAFNQQAGLGYNAPATSQGALASEWNPQPPAYNQAPATTMPLSSYGASSNAYTSAPVTVAERTVVVDSLADPAQVHHHHHSGNRSRRSQHERDHHHHHHSSHHGSDDRHRHHHHHHTHEGQSEAVILNGTLNGMTNNQSGMLASSSTNAPIEETVMKPVIVEETVRTDTLVEVQPIITRHVDQTFVNHIEKHIYESAAPLGVSTVTSAPIVNEVIHPHYIDEITEIIHREVPVVQVQKVQEFSEESILLPTEHTHETRVLGTDFQGLASSQQDLNQGLNLSQDATLSKDMERMNLGMGRQQGMQAGGSGSAQL